MSKGRFLFKTIVFSIVIKLWGKREIWTVKKVTYLVGLSLSCWVVCSGFIKLGDRTGESWVCEKGLRELTFLTYFLCFR